MLARRFEPAKQLPPKQLPPKRRTRYDSELLEIEFNPYIEDGQMYVVRHPVFSDMSDEAETDDDGTQPCILALSGGLCGER